MSIKVFSAGTARGGTNFRTLMLKNHSKINMAIDPLIPLFRRLRDDLHIEEGIKSETLPNLLDDYYFSKEKIKSLEIVQTKKRAPGFNLENWNELEETIKQRMSLASMNLIPFVSSLKSQSYESIFDNFFNLIERLGQEEGKDIQVCGFNDNWTSEFFPLLSNIFPNSKFLLHLRDPRAVVFSSEYAEPDIRKHPTILSLARHLRKVLSLAHHYKTVESLKGKLLTTYYEPFVFETESELGKCCEFLGVNFESEMMNISNFKKANGESWPSGPQIYQETVNHWQTECPRELIEVTEFICGPEMTLHNYRPSLYDPKVGLSGKTFDFIKKNNETCLGWRTDFNEIEKTLGCELYRESILTNKRNIERDEVERCFLFESVYNELKKSKDLYVK